MSFYIGVIDDDSEMLTAISRVIKQCGHTVCSYPTADHALVACAVKKLDLLFCDVQLHEGLSSDEFLKLLSIENLDIPIVMMSCSMPNELSQHLKSLGAAVCVQKPFFHDECRTLIERCMGTGSSVP